MLDSTLVRAARVPGLSLLHRRGAPGGARELSIWRICLEPGQTVEHRLLDEEAIVVLQHGDASFRVDGHSWRVARAGVFAERATAVYVPPGMTFGATAHDTPVEAILCATPAIAGGAPAIIRPGDVEVHDRGRANYAREVHDLFVRDSHAQRLMVGETFNPPGHWSSYPPHKHDGRDGEPTLEEVYYYRVDPPQGFGQQILYTSDGESVSHTVRDGDAVVIPYGYHPVTSPPGYRLYYLWALAGAERKLALYEDPAHKWVAGA